MWVDKLRSEITMKRFVKRIFVWWKLKLHFSWTLDFWLDLGIRQNIICQLLQWAISPKFSPSKILYRTVIDAAKQTDIYHHLRVLLAEREDVSF